MSAYCMERLLSGDGSILCFNRVFFSPKPVSLRRCRRMRFRENQNRYVSIDVLETSFLQTMVFISLLVLPFLHPSLRTCVSIGVLETPFLQTMVFVSLLVLPFWHRPPQNLCFNTCFGNSISPKHCFYKSFNCMLLNSFLKNSCFIQ